MTNNRTLPISPFTVAVIAGFISTFTVNGILLYYAISSQVGLIEDRPYEQGDLYEQSLIEQRAVAKQGWQVEIIPTKENLTMTFSNEKGSKTSITRVQLITLRPDRRSPDITSETTSTGATPIFQFAPLPLKGLWIAKIRFWNDADEVFEIRRNLFIR